MPVLPAFAVGWQQSTVSQGKVKFPAGEQKFYSATKLGAR